MKVIVTDNYDRDYISDRLCATNLPPAEAQALADALNHQAGHVSPDFYKAVEDDYKLYKALP